MANFDKTSRLWVVNIISFLLLCVLSFTGLVNGRRRHEHVDTARARHAGRRTASMAWSTGCCSQGGRHREAGS